MPPTNWFSQIWIYVKEKPSVRNTLLMTLLVLYFGVKDYYSDKNNGEVAKAWHEMYNAKSKDYNDLSAKYETRIDKDILKAETKSDKNDSLIMTLSNELNKKSNDK